MVSFDPTPHQQSVLDLVAAGHRGVLATIRRDGRPQLSNVAYAYDPDRRQVRVSVTADRAKARNLERDGRASLHVTTADFWQWAVVSGDATLTPVAGEAGDASVDALVEYYRAANGEHEDWDDYRAAMVAEGRQLVTIDVTGAYGQVG